FKIEVRHADGMTINESEVVEALCAFAPLSVRYVVRIDMLKGPRLTEGSRRGKDHRPSSSALVYFDYVVIAHIARQGMYDRKVGSLKIVAGPDPVEYRADPGEGGAAAQEAPVDRSHTLAQDMEALALAPKA